MNQAMTTTAGRNAAAAVRSSTDDTNWTRRLLACGLMAARCSSAWR
jgi:hypothetical protein